MKSWLLRITHLCVNRAVGDGEWQSKSFWTQIGFTYRCSRVKRPFCVAKIVYSASFCVHETNQNVCFCKFLCVCLGVWVCDAVGVNSSFIFSFSVKWWWCHLVDLPIGKRAVCKSRRCWRVGLKRRVWELTVWNERLERESGVGDQEMGQKFRQVHHSELACCWAKSPQLWLVMQHFWIEKKTSLCQGDGCVVTEVESSQVGASQRLVPLLGLEPPNSWRCRTSLWFEQHEDSTPLNLFWYFVLCLDVFFMLCEKMVVRFCVAVNVDLHVCTVWLVCWEWPV